MWRLGFLFLINSVLAGNRIVLFEFELFLNRLLILGRIIGVALADTFGVPYRNEFYQMVL